MPAPRHSRIARAVERWFGEHQRDLPWRISYDPYQVWVSEVMAQQTRIEVVERYFPRFVARFPDVAGLAAASPDEVAAEWSGLGYYRRAKLLHAGAIDVMERFGGVLPRDVEPLLTIPGIGRYTAGAIASIAFERRAPIVDGNVARILARLEGRETPWEDSAALVAASRKPRDFNQGLMEIGALICRPRNPLCAECPLRGECVALASDRIHELPAKKEKAAPQLLRVGLYLVRDRKGRILLCREEGKLMGSLFHLPHADTSLLSATPLEVRVGERIGAFRHSITTRRIEFELFHATLPRRDRIAAAGSIGDGESDYIWIALDELRLVPHPSYVAKALQLLRNRVPGSGVARGDD